MRWGSHPDGVQACLTGCCLCRRFYLEIIGRRRFRVLSSFEQVSGWQMQGCAAFGSAMLLGRSIARLTLDRLALAAG